MAETSGTVLELALIKDKILKVSLEFFITFICICESVSHCMCGGQRTRELGPSVWVLGIESRPLALVASAFTSCAISPAQELVNLVFRDT